MTVADVLKAAHFVVDEAGQRTAVIVDIDDWSRLMAVIETVVDQRIAQTALNELAAADGDPGRAGWLDWRSTRSEWLDDDDASGD